MRPTLGLYLLAATLVATPALALDTDRNAPFRMNAVSVEIDQKAGTALYRGNVVMTQGSLRLEADRVEAKMKDGHLVEVTALGKPTRVRARRQEGEEEMLADAERIVYRADTRDLELTGSAYVRQGANEFRAHYILYGLDDQRLSALGSDEQDGRVQAVYYPESKTAEQ